MEYLNVGKIVNTFGIKGEVKIYPAHDYFEELDHLVIQEKSYWPFESANQPFLNQ